MQRIYLDTNHWIMLLRIKQGKETDGELRNAYDAIIELTKSDQIRVLFSIFTLIEIQQHHNEVKRDELVDFILDTSKLYGLRSYSTFANREIENAMEYVLRCQYVHDIHSKILGRGLQICESGPDNLTTSRKLTSPTDLSKYKIIKRWWEILSYHPIFVKRVLKYPGMTAAARNSRKDYAEMINTLERQRIENNGLSSDEIYSRTRANHLIGLEKRTIPLIISKGIKLEQLYSSMEQIELMYKHLNSLNVKSLLIYERSISAEKSITYNDFLDIEHLAGAIPYCDIVVSDKMAVDLCRRKKLGEMYNCHILNSLKELPAYLPVVNSLIN